MPPRVSVGPGDSVLGGCCVATAGTSFDIKGAPHISQDNKEGWLENVQRGHWKPSVFVEFGGGELICNELRLPILPSPGFDCRLAIFDIAAFRTSVRAGLIPQARHGGNGVCAVAVVGSKLEGTGLGKLHIVQTHVAVVAWEWLGGGDRSKGSDVGKGEEDAAAAMALDCNDARFAGLGISVTFADDFRNPA